MDVSELSLSELILLQGQIDNTIQVLVANDGLEEEIESLHDGLLENQYLTIKVTIPVDIVVYDTNGCCIDIVEDVEVMDSVIEQAEKHKDVKAAIRKIVQQESGLDKSVAKLAKKYRVSEEFILNRVYRE